MNEWKDESTEAGLYWVLWLSQNIETMKLRKIEDDEIYWEYYVDPGVSNTGWLRLNELQKQHKLKFIYIEKPKLPSTGLEELKMTAEFILQEVNK